MWGAKAVQDNYFVATVHWWANNMTNGKENKKKKKKERKRKKEKETTTLKITGLLHYCTLPLEEFLWFPTVSLLVEMVAPIRTFATVCLVVTFAVDALEWMRARLAILCSEPWRIQLIILFAALWFFPVILRFVRTIAYNTSGCMWLTPKRWMAPFLTALTPKLILVPWTVAMNLPILKWQLIMLFALEPNWESQILTQMTAELELGRSLDDLWLREKFDIFEDMQLFEYFFN